MKTIALGTVHIEIWGGAGEIGGNQILLRDGEDALLLDFGRSFKRWDMYFTEFMQPRGVKGLRDLLKLQLIPSIPELYRDLPDDTLFPTNAERQLIKGSSIGTLHGVLLSHAHLDHAGAIAYLRSDLPIYTSAESAVILKATQDTGNSDMDAEVTYFTPRLPLTDKGILRPEGKEYLRRPYYLLDSASVPEFSARSPAKTKALAGAVWQAARQPVQVGPFKVEALPVDHSIPGALAFLIHTSQGIVAYSGDIRFHGERAKASEAFLKRLEQQPLLALIVEGTRLGRPSETHTEDQVQGCIYDAVAQHPGKPVAIDFATRNIERMKRCANVARETQRELVVTAKDAYLLLGLSELHEAHRDLLSQVRVLQEPKVQSKGWEELVWEQPTIKPVTTEAIARAPGDFVLAFGFFELNRLLDIRLAANSDNPEGIYIFSNSFWADDEQILNVRILRNWLRMLNFKLLPDAFNRVAEDGAYDAVDNCFHTSGHASEEDLVRLVQRAAPEHLIPVHTEKPERWLHLLSGLRTQVHV
ncbi:MAG: MBL fold metallo-hydrolase [Thermoflexales bacterium]|nr:MBL fold metallo-hydrolase [Thermoflexales bacterium]